MKKCIKNEIDSGLCYFFNKVGFSSNAQTRIKYIQNETVAVTKNINLTPKGDIPKNSAIPPHTPYKALSFEDFISFLNLISPPILEFI